MIQTQTSHHMMVWRVPLVGATMVPSRWRTTMAMMLATAMPVAVAPTLAADQLTAVSTTATRPTVAVTWRWLTIARSFTTIHIQYSLDSSRDRWRSMCQVRVVQALLLAAVETSSREAGAACKRWQKRICRSLSMRSLTVQWSASWKCFTSIHSLSHSCRWSKTSVDEAKIRYSAVSVMNTFSRVELWFYMSSVDM